MWKTKSTVCPIKASQCTTNHIQTWDSRKQQHELHICVLPFINVMIILKLCSLHYFGLWINLRNVKPGYLCMIGALCYASVMQTKKEEMHVHGRKR